ncbi:MAG: pilus assembly protein TadG-related protein, partial [Pseudomonas sp.]
MKITLRRRREQGQTILLVAVSLVALLGMAALAIDIVTLYVARAEAQRAADGAALAGAQMLVSTGLTTDPCNA